jgi:tetratricopeptide (TPR) repeat protein
MNSLSAENYFKKGLAALVDQNHEDASAFFRRALELDRDRNRRQPDMRYLSYYGFSLARSGQSSTTAIQACRQAVAKQPLDPVLLLNLGRVYALAGKCTQALDAFERGLELAPDSRVLAQERDKLDRRGRPFVAALSREHPINKTLGRLRARFVGRPRTLVRVVTPASRS